MRRTITILHSEPTEKIIEKSRFITYSARVESEEEAKAFNPKETIFEHLGDEYGWNNGGRVTLPLPVIVRGDDGSWHVFSSSRLEDGKNYEGFYIDRGGKYEGKVVGTDAAGQVYRPYDFSITKNVLSVMISALITMLIAFSLVRYYRRNKYKAPRKKFDTLSVNRNCMGEADSPSRRNSEP